MEINYLAVLVAGILPMFVGALWYGPLFGKTWMRLMNTTEEEIKASMNPLKTYGVTFVLSLIAAFVLAHIVTAFGVAGLGTGWAAGLQGGFWCWLGFVLTLSYQTVAFEDRRVPLYLLNAAYNLVSLLAMGALLGAWPAWNP